MDILPPMDLHDDAAPRSASEIRAEELRFIEAVRRSHGRDPLANDLPGDGIDGQALASDLVGLAFSGGGIRSATFNLGILRAFARSGFLKSIDYLSTVSGGGYIGAWW